MTALAWADAMAACSAARAFDQVQQAQGWPDAVTTAQAAALQRPYNRGDRAGRAHCNALAGALLAACEAGEVAHEAVTRRVMVSPALDVLPSIRIDTGGWPDHYRNSYGEPLAYTREAQYSKETVQWITAAAFVAWLQTQGEVPGKHVAAWVSAIENRHQAPAIEPPAGWVPNCAHGLQRSDSSHAGRLVRLEDVAAWFAQVKELPRDRAVGAMLGPLVMDDGLELCGLFVLNPDNYAKCLFEGDTPSRGTIDFWQHLPDVGGQSSPGTVAHAIAEEWRRCWPGVAPEAGEGQPPMQQLCRLAIRLTKAHELWGYGHVVAAAAEVVSLVPVPEAVSPFPLADLAALVAYRKAHRGASWVDGNQIDVGKAAVQKEIDAGSTKSDARESVAQKLGIARQTLEKNLYSARKRKTPASGLVVGQLIARNGK